MDDHDRMYSCSMAAGDYRFWSYARFYAWRFS